MKIAIIKETKTPTDNRTPFTPDQCKILIEKYNMLIKIQPSNLRCFRDEEYETVGCEISENIHDCDFLFGIKEVAKAHLIPNKTYFIFSHTKKKQVHNQNLIRAFIDKKITVIDYECLVHKDGSRILGFGTWAGIVGAHNGLLHFGKRNNLYTLTPAHQCKDFAALKNKYKGFILPPIKIAVTGNGRVAQGIIEIMTLLNIPKVCKLDYIQKKYDHAVYVHISGETLYVHKEKNNYNREDFHAHPTHYRNLFMDIAPYTDILMNGVYWDKNIPRLFDTNDVSQSNWNIFTIADISCDEQGSVPICIISTTIANPVFGYHRYRHEPCAPYQKDSIDMMTIDNLPNELPRDASTYFGNKLIEYIIPELSKEKSELLQKATITIDGHLGTYFEYLQDYVDSALAPNQI